MERHGGMENGDSVEKKMWFVLGLRVLESGGWVGLML